MEDLLKGNFKVKKPVVDKQAEKSKMKKGSAEEIAKNLKKSALASIGGSMVYVERTDLVWDGDDDSSK